MLLENYEHINRRIYNAIHNPELKYSDIERIVQSDHTLTYTPTFFCVVNPDTLEVLYLSKNVHECLGLDMDDFQKKGMKHLWNCIHKEDLKILTLSLENLLNYFLTELETANGLQLSYSWNYRLMTKNCNQITIIQHTTPFVYARTNNRRSLKYFTVIRNNQKLPIKASINAIDSDHNFKTLFSTNCSQITLMRSISNRERDIIELLNQNLSSKDIGKRLYISSNTVDTHRRNILKKLRLSSTGELKAIINSGQFVF